jgi:hypothetical protein
MDGTNLHDQAKSSLHSADTNHAWHDQMSLLSQIALELKIGDGMRGICQGFCSFVSDVMSLIVSIWEEVQADSLKTAGSRPSSTVGGSRELGSCYANHR